MADGHLGGPRIAVVEALAQPGGAQLSLLELVRCTRGRAQFEIVFPGDGPMLRLAEEAGAGVHVLEWPRSLARVGERASTMTSIAGLMKLAPTLVRLRRLIDALRVDVVVTNGIKPHLFGTLAELTSKRPLVWYLRDGMEDRRRSGRILRALAKRCTRAIAISRFIERDAIQHLGAEIPIDVIYNIVDTSRFTSEIGPPIDLRKADAEVWFACIGALTPLKGQDMFLRAAQKVAARLPAARFLIVGANFYSTVANTDYDEKLRVMASLPGLTDRVRFLGHRDDIHRILPLIDVLVHFNRGPEAFGRTVAEAMASGVPVIAADKWGPAELIRNGVSGRLVPALDVGALTDVMVELGSDHVSRLRLGQAASSAIAGVLDAQASAEQFLLAISRARQASSAL